MRLHTSISKREAARGILALLTFSGMTTSQAQLSVDVSGVGGAQLPIAVGDFVVDTPGAPQVASVIRSDLTRLGMFKVIEPGQVSDLLALRYDDFRSRGADAVVGGRITRLADGRLDIRFRLHDVLKQAQLAGSAYEVAPAQSRAVGHKIADQIVEKLTGEKGIFSTRVSFVSKQAGRYRLNISDWDGENVQTAISSPEPIISPAWSPDGARIAYVSFENKKPIVYVQHIASEQRTVVANFKGNNSAPSWSPDGKQLALALTRDGNSQLYLVNADGSNPRRLTNSTAIDTEPQFSRDGQSVYFTSDRGGSPQIYRVSTAGGEPSRVTFNSPYSVSARISPDGKSMAYVVRRGSGFYIAVKDLSSGNEQVVSDGGREESPSFSPNSRWIMYASKSAGRDVLMTMSVDGKYKQRLSSPASDIREPAWGPYSK
jgi:TolB protein